MNAPAPAVNDASLKLFKHDIGKPAPGFWSERYEHAILFTSDVESFTFTATAANEKSTLTLDGKPLTSGQPSPAVNIPVGRSYIVIEVTAPDGETRKKYTFKLLRAQPLPNWKRVIEHAPFAARDSAGQVVHNGKMVVLGGYLPELVSDVWESANGVDWKQVGNIDNPAGINIPVSFSYNGKIWTTTNDGKFYSSPDGKDWTLVNAMPPWGKRYAAGCAVFAGKMWVAGGAGGIDAADSGIRNDLWSSTDGVNWKLELEHAPWSPRQLFGNFLVHNNRLYVVGGGIVGYQPFRSYREVWSSPDGVNWTLETDNAPFDTRIWSDVVSYQGRLWLLGGFEAEPRWKNFNDLWYSVDGKTWKLLKTESIWSERHEISPFVYDGKIWVVAGNAWPLVNDVWQFSVDRLTFISQPLNEDYALAQYRYQAVADFNRSASPVRYRMVAGPDWLKIDAATGVLGGRMPAKGDYTIELEASDEQGETATQRFTLHVLA